MLKSLAISVLFLAFASVSAAAQEANGCVDISDNGDSSLVDRDFVPTGTPLLSRFGFDFGDEDNHILHLLIYPGFSPGKVRLDYSDKEPDDQWPASDDDYCYNLTHFDISDARIRQVTRGRDVCRGTCTVRLDKPAGDFVFVLVGFQLQFHGDDNHIKEIKMLENNGDFTVAYRDQELGDPTDTFIWDLQYAYVPRDRFSQIGELVGTRAKDRVIGTIPAGRAVLRGFRFEYKPYFTSGNDHHIQQISIRPNTTGTVFLTYRDQNGDDGFDWEYRWAIIRTLGPRPGETVPVEDPIWEHLPSPGQNPPVEPPKGNTDKQ